MPLEILPEPDYDFSWIYDFETNTYITTKTDGEGEDNNYSWTTITTVYDASEFEFPLPLAAAAPEKEIEGPEGRFMVVPTFPVEPPFAALEVLSITTVFDNGILKEETFEDGQLAQLVSVDTLDVKDWALQGKLFDEEGNLKALVRLSDDNVLTGKEFAYSEEGDRFVVNKISLDLSEDGSAKNWESIICEFDEVTGDLLTKTTDYDDGRLRVETHTPDGKVVNWTDVDDEFDWATKEITFDEEGNKETAVVVQDDGDITSTLFEQGNRLTRIEVDGDGSEDWFARQVIYDDEGSVVYTDEFTDIADLIGTAISDEFALLSWHYHGGLA